MGKERYMVMEHFGRYVFHDTLCDKYYSALAKDNAQNLVTLLNQQDARIKELEKIRDKGNQKLENIYNKKIDKFYNESNKYFKKLIKENQQLKKENLRLIDNSKREFSFYAEQIKKLDQSQNEKAIEALEKVKNYFIKNGDCFLIDGCELEEYINSQIK